jgi:geranylgeranyl diphosphate synthase type II
MMEQAKYLKEVFERSAREYFAHRRAETPNVSALLDSIEYSFFNGGKRFRPLLCYGVGEALGLSEGHVTPLAMAVEAIHTYSLIHDDLPCMDDDHERRGQPTNHIQFSEEMALLAGDSLLTEAFLMLAQAYPEHASPLIEQVSQAAGLRGMIRGQVLDLGLGQPVECLADLIHLHEMKTGQLIALCFVGPAILAGRPSQEFYELGLQLGLAFQVKDDLLDAEGEEEVSFIRFLGEEGSRQHLQSLTEKLATQLKSSGLRSPFLIDLIQYNFSRAK